MSFSWLRRSVSALLVVLATGAASVFAQQTRGGLRDPQGEPVSGAVVAGFAADGACVGEVVTGEDGRFEFAAGLTIVRVRAYLEAIETPLQDVAVEGADTELQLDGAWWTLSGRVLLPDGRPAAGVDVGACGRRSSLLATVTTDENGKFSVRSNRKLRAIAIDPMAWQHEIEGPFTETQTLLVDLRECRQLFERHVGRVFDLDGIPAEGALVIAEGPSGRCAGTRSASDGGFVLWTKRTPTRVTAHYAGLRFSRGPGDWRPGVPLDFEPELDLIVMVRGRVVDGDGMPVEGALLFTSLDGRLAPGSAAVGQTDSEGQFVVPIRRGTKFLVAKLGAGQLALAAAPAAAAAVGTAVEEAAEPLVLRPRTR